MDSSSNNYNFSPEDHVKIVEVMNNFLSEDVSAIMSSFESAGWFDYCPFNVGTLDKQIKGIAKANRMNAHQIMVEMTEIVKLALTYGNLKQDQIQRITDHNLKNKVNTIIKKWCISIKKNAKDKTAHEHNSLTFTRVLCVFPQIASELLMRNPERYMQKLPTDADKYVAKTYKLPMAMKHMGFGALIPRGISNIVYNKILEVAYLAFLAEFSFTINPNSGKTFADAYGSQQGQKTAAIKGPMSDADRIRYLMSMGLDTVEAVRSMVDVANLAMVACGYPTRYSMDTFQPLIQGDKVKIVEDDAVYAQIVPKAAKIAQRSDNTSGASSSQQGSDTASGNTSNG